MFSRCTISLIVKPEYTLIVYGILAVTVLASRVLVRAPRGAKPVRQPEQAEAAAEPMRAAA